MVKRRTLINIQAMQANEPEGLGAVEPAPSANVAEALDRMTAELRRLRQEFERAQFKADQQDFLADVRDELEGLGDLMDDRLEGFRKDLVEEIRDLR